MAYLVHDEIVKSLKYSRQMEILMRAVTRV